MGAELITLDWTAENPADPRQIDLAVADLADVLIDRLMDESQPLGWCDSTDEARLALKRGATEYQLVIFGDHRYGTSQQIRDDLWHYTAGAESWGDDPFDGFSDLWAFLEACALDSFLASVSGFVSWGIAADSAKEAHILTMIAQLMHEEGVPAGKIELVIRRAGKALGIKESD